MYKKELKPPGLSTEVAAPIPLKSPCPPQTTVPVCLLSPTMFCPRDACSLVFSLSLPRPISVSIVIPPAMRKRMDIVSAPYATSNFQFLARQDLQKTDHVAARKPPIPGWQCAPVALPRKLRAAQPQRESRPPGCTQASHAGPSSHRHG